MHKDVALAVVLGLFLVSLSFSVEKLDALHTAVNHREKAVWTRTLCVCVVTAPWDKFCIKTQ